MPTPRRTQKQRREQAEAALLAASAELVVERGARALTLAGVGERAGYSRGIVTHHFGSKHALLERLARSVQAGFVPGLDELRPGLDRLLGLVDGYIGEIGRGATAQRAFLVLWTEALTTPELASVFRERDEAFRADLRDDVAAGIADGTVRGDLVPAEVATAIVAQLRGIGLQRLLDPDAIDTEHLRRSITEQWRRALAAQPTRQP
ncbi:TetR/AcrR family transcriptional regulator [Streptomyces sp. RK9]|uniref:TetR/AcrR family transcriptional regulator n=1 Tax=Streptomyces sp. RK9 TaxID=3239284 RepID=UPI003863A048